MADRATLPNLKPFLDNVIARCNLRERRENDPIGLVHGFESMPDREIAALVCSSLAYGRVDLLRDAARDVLSRMGGNPAAFLRDVNPAEYPGLFDGFVYRMTRGADVADLLAGASSLLREYDSLGAVYAAGDGSHLERSSHFVGRLRDGRLRNDVERGFRYLIPDPLDGSAAKRMHLFFRWVSRGPDVVDLGIWEAPSPAELVMPLDTHTARICRYLGLTSRRTTNLKTALEVTKALRQFDPDDPLRYDFALCHLGISGSCIHRRSEEHCPTCPIEPVCRLT